MKAKLDEKSIWNCSIKNRPDWMSFPQCTRKKIQLATFPQIWIQIESTFFAKFDNQINAILCKSALQILPIVITSVCECECEYVCVCYLLRKRMYHVANFLEVYKYTIFGKWWVLKRDFYRGWYQPSTGVRSIFLPRDLDLYFQRRKLKILIYANGKS